MTRLRGYREVANCPQSESAWKKAAIGLNCSLNSNQLENRYHCMPDANLGNTVEFCFIATSPLIAKGNCGKITSGEIIDYVNCTIFKKGCPDTYFRANDMYKYPMCNAINRNQSCYMSVPGCDNSKIATGGFANDSNTLKIVLPIAIVVPILVILMLVFVCWCRRRHRGQENASSEGTLLKDVLPDIIRILILGDTGKGKSATGNTILKENKFPVGMSARSVTTVCESGSVTRDGQTFKVVDTVGINDSSKSNRGFKNDIKKLRKETNPGPHVILLVLKVEGNIPVGGIQYIEKKFGKDIFDHCILLFTHRDILEDRQKTFDDFMLTADNDVKDIIQKCDNRIIAFHNETENFGNDEQVKELIRIINTTVQKNNNKFWEFPKSKQSSPSSSKLICC